MCRILIFFQDKAIKTGDSGEHKQKSAEAILAKAGYKLFGEGLNVKWLDSEKATVQKRKQQPILSKGGQNLS